MSSRQMQLPISSEDFHLKETKDHNNSHYQKEEPKTLAHCTFCGLRAAKEGSAHKAPVETRLSSHTGEETHQGQRQ